MDPEKKLSTQERFHIFHKEQVHDWSRLVMLLILNADIGGSKVEGWALLT